MSDSIWSDIGTFLVDKGMPLLGGAISGPVGAGLAGLLANAMGSKDTTPETLLAQLKTASPELLSKVQDLEFKHEEKLAEIALQNNQAELSAHTARIQSVNATMQVEAKSSGLASIWRPIWGLISAVAFFILCVAIAIKMFYAPGDLPAILTGMASLEWFWGIPLAILGVASWHRGQEKRVLAGEKKMGLTGLVNAIKGKANV